MNSNTNKNLTVRINNRDLPIRLQGTSDCPYFCGKDVCTVLDYKDIKQALQTFIASDDKKSLKELNNVSSTPNSFIGTYIPNLSYHDGKAVYINEKGLYSLLNSSRSPNKVQLRAFIDQFLYDLRYKSGIMDIFSFMKGKDIEIDVQSEWFQDLWYPLSKKQHILGSMLLLTWLGYEGEYYTQRQRFQKLLSNNSIPYEEVDYSDERFREHEVMIKEVLVCKIVNNDIIALIVFNFCQDLTKNSVILRKTPRY